MTHLPVSLTVTTALALILIAFVAAMLLPLLWSHSLTARFRQINKARREWHPRSPVDCLHCSRRISHQPVDLVEIIPCKATRSPRGARKHLSSESVSCPNAQCMFFGCAFESVHAIVSCGVRGKTDRIRRWKYQACGDSVSERKFTPLYHLKTSPTRISLVMVLLANGLDPSAASRVFSHDHRTVSHWLSRSGYHAAALHNLYFRRLYCSFLQLDELVTNIRGDEQRTFVWTAIDSATKIMPHVHVGRRTIDDAFAFVHVLIERLALDHLPIFSPDGLRHYFSALTAHFGSWQLPAPPKRKHIWHVDPRLLFGMLYKIKSGRRLNVL